METDGKCIEADDRFPERKDKTDGNKEMIPVFTTLSRP